MTDQRPSAAPGTWFVTNGTDWYVMAGATHDLDKIVHEPDGETTAVLKPRRTSNA